MVMVVVMVVVMTVIIVVIHTYLYSYLLLLSLMLLSFVYLQLSEDLLHHFENGYRKEEYMNKKKHSFTGTNSNLNN